MKRPIKNSLNCSSNNIVMKRITLTLLIALFATLALNAKVYIRLVKSTSGGHTSSAKAGIRTSVYAPLAYIEDERLCIQFPVSTVSSVVITNDSTDVAILSETFQVESTDVSMSVATLMQDHAYNLSVNAFGTWWVGYFDYVVSSAEQSIQKGFIGTIDDPDKERNYGLYFVAGNASPGWSYGVSGIVSGQNYGTGIYGSSLQDEGFNTGGRFAGLFHGDIKTTDAVYASAYNTLADSRLNKDIEQLENGSLDNLMQVSVFKYGLKQFDVDNGDNSTSLGYYNDDSGILDKEHYGLSGQEIQQIYPNLVTQNQDGYLSVNYVEMVPLLIQSIKELKAELDNTNAQLELLKTGTKVAIRMTDQAVLFQNTPNPFKTNCIVKCIIPQNVKEALFCLYDYSGRQIECLEIHDRDNVEIPVDGYVLEPGIYLYSLITDGEIVDTKRMVSIE